LSGKISIQDFLIAKEVKLGNYRAKTLPPGAHLSVKRIENDPRSEPQYGERVPFVVVYKGPNQRLIDTVVSPEELLNDNSLRLNGLYYINKQIIPALQRVFGLVGGDVQKWFNEMPKEARAISYSSQDEKTKFSVKTIDYYYKPTHCLVCKVLSKHGMCSLTKICVTNVKSTRQTRCYF
jgi:DNA polymerase elongation subunit (family B)